jgi:PIN domain nuclease of toxin-antitoxin system
LNGYLLDTDVILLALSEPRRIPRHVRDAVEKERLYMSVLSYWEVVLKVAKGKLHIDEPRAWWGDALENLAATAVPLRAEHVSALYDLPPIHQDPFDRMLIAQAIADNLHLVTTDSEIQKYASNKFRVLC